MNIFRTSASQALAAALALPLLALAFAGCDIDSVDSTTAVPSDDSGTIYNFSGLYMSPENGTSSNGVLPLVYPYEGSSHPSGALITFLRLLQYGSVLEAYDSAGQTWSGAIAGLSGSTATFNLQGRTSAGQPVEISGTMVYAEQNSIMDATWIEPAYYGTLRAKASVPPSATNTPVSDDLEINPDGTITLSTNGASQAFSASGGSGSYTWLFSGSGGSLTTSSGSSTTFTRSSTGSGVISVSSDGQTATATILCP